MATSASRVITITLTGDVVGTETLTAAANAAASGQIELKTLSAGDNTITAPTGGSTLSCVTMVPPANNSVVITLKGVGGDTGILLHKTDPTSLALVSTVTTFVINVATQVVGYRFIWT